MAYLALSSVCLLLLGEAVADTQVRLVGGSSNGTGRLELSFNNQWNTVYNSYVHANEAKVVCRMLGFNNTGIAHVYRDASVLFPGGQGLPVITSQLQCKGTETDIEQCLRYDPTWTTSQSSHSYDVGITCERTQVRLVDGDTPMSGRVEMYFKGGWTSVCDSSFDNDDARVICRMLGHEGSGIVQSFRASHFGTGVGNHIITSLSCNGYETDLKLCDATWNPGQCTHRGDAGVNCGSTPIRLVNGPNNSSGRVEIKHAGSWGTICANYDRFDHLDAAVVCRMLGFNYTNAIGYGNGFYGQGLGSVVTSSLKCDGSEVDIANCPSHAWTKPSDTPICDHTSDVGVNCAGVTPIRLVDGISEQSGRVEIYHNGHWGTVNSQYFDSHDLMVICRMLGYEYSSKSFFLPKSHYGSGIGEVVVSRMECNGAERDIGECKAIWWPDTSSDHTNDVGVNCDGEIPIRLVNGPTKASGRVEILHNGNYGTMCDRDFDRYDLIVVCRMLGYDNIPTNAYWHKGSYFGQGLGEMVVSDLKCNGIEQNIGQCNGRWPASSYCDHSSDVSVSCDGSTELLRLVDGRHNYSGRVEVLHSGGWGRICDRNFDRADAVVICRMLKMTNPETAVAHKASAYGRGNGTLVATSLHCNGLETTLEQCNPTWLPTTCYGGDAGVDCCPSCASTPGLVG